MINLDIMSRLRTVATRTRHDLDEHRADCLACGIWWEPCDVGVALMRADVDALDAIDQERRKSSAPSDHNGRSQAM